MSSVEKITPISQHKAHVEFAYDTQQDREAAERARRRAEKRERINNAKWNRSVGDNEKETAKRDAGLALQPLGLASIIGFGQYFANTNPEFFDSDKLAEMNGVMYGIEAFLVLVSLLLLVSVSNSTRKAERAYGATRGAMGRRM